MASRKTLTSLVIASAMTLSLGCSDSDDSNDDMDTSVPDSVTEINEPTPTQMP